VLERILVLALAQDASTSETKPRLVNAVTLEVTPQQAEQIDLARSVGSLSLVLRSQVDTGRVDTQGASMEDLFKPVEKIIDKTNDNRVVPTAQQPRLTVATPIKRLSDKTDKTDKTDKPEIIRGSVKTLE
jgi:pilus assembly protein CpaB